MQLPPGAEGPIEVYVNGVRQQEGKDFVRRDGELVFSRSLAQEGKLGFWRWTLALPRRRRHLPAERECRRRVRGRRKENRRIRVAYPGGGADRADGKARVMNDRDRDTRRRALAALDARAAQLADPARRRRARARGGDGARRHGGLQPARGRRAGRRPDLVRRLLRRPGRRLSRLRARGARHRRVDGGPLLSFRLSMRTVVAGFGVFAATHAAGGFSVDYWTFRRSGLRRREAVARVLALGALEYAVLAPAAMICAVVLLFGTGGHVQHAMTYPWLAVDPRLLRRALGELAEAGRRGSPTRATAAVSASGSPTLVAGICKLRCLLTAPRSHGLGRRRRQPLLARRHRLPLGGAEDLQRGDLDARADPRLRDRLRRHAALAARRAAPGWSR